MQLTPEQLERLDKAGCYVPRRFTPQGVRHRPPSESAVIEWLEGKLPGETPCKVALSLCSSSIRTYWQAAASYMEGGGIISRSAERPAPLRALYDLALAVGAVKEGTE